MYFWMRPAPGTRAPGERRDPSRGFGPTAYHPGCSLPAGRQPLYLDFQLKIHNGQYSHHNPGKGPL